MTTPGQTGRRGPAPGSLVWWLVQVVGLALAMGLMLVLAFALMMLTRMLVEGDSEPTPHLPTVLAWWVLCGGWLLWHLVGGAWRELRAEQVHVDLAGQELRVDRWSPPHERERFAERVAADERARQSAAAREGATPREDTAARTSASRPQATDDELRAAARRRREVGPGLPTPVPTGRWSVPLRRLRGVALTCLYAWLPAIVLGALVSPLVGRVVDREWSLLPFVLLPLGVVLLWAHRLLQHRWQRTRESRGELAGFHVACGFVGAVLFAILGFTGLVMRDEALGVALISFPLVALSIWTVRHELPYTDTDTSPYRPGPAVDLTRLG